MLLPLVLLSRDVKLRMETSAKNRRMQFRTWPSPAATETVIISWDVGGCTSISVLTGTYVHGETLARSLTSQIRRKSCCSTRSSSQVVFVTTVLSLGKSCRIDSPKVAPTPKLHSVTGCRKGRGGGGLYSSTVY